jgi:hypothetical protein
VRLAKIQDGVGRHLEKQNYVITTVFIGRSCSNFVGRTRFILVVHVSTGLERRLADIQDGGGSHLEKQKYIITAVFIGRSFSNVVWNPMHFRSVSIGLEMKLANFQDGGRHLLK